MRKNHHGKKDRLVKRVFALCLALAVICTCLVPVFATEGLIDPQVHQEASRPVDDGEASYPDDEFAGFGGDEAAGFGEPREVYDEGEAAGFGEDEVATRPVEGGEDNLDGGPTVTDSEWGTVIEYGPSSSTGTDPEPETQWSGEDDVVEKPDDKVVVSGDEIKKLQDMVVYRFWLKELNTLDLQDITAQAQINNMTESEYLARNGEVLWNLYFIQAVPRAETIADYSSYIENPSSNRDPKGELRQFDYWYTLDEFGNRVRLNLTDPTSNILDDKTTTVNVYAAWKDGTVGSDEEEDVDHEDLVDKNPVPVDLTAKAAASYEDEDGELKTTTLPVEVKNLPSAAHSLSVIHMGDDDMESFYESHEDDFGSMAPILGLKISPKNAKGETVQPAKGQKAVVSVSGLDALPYMVKATAGELKVLHQTADGSVETLDVLSYQNGTLTFETSSFSPFVLALEYPDQESEDFDDDGIEIVSIEIDGVEYPNVNDGIATISSISGIQGDTKVPVGATITLRAKNGKTNYNHTWRLNPDKTNGNAVFINSKNTEVNQIKGTGDTYKTVRIKVTQEGKVTVAHRYGDPKSKDPEGNGDELEITVVKSDNPTSPYNLYVYTQVLGYSGSYYGNKVENKAWNGMAVGTISNVNAPSSYSVRTSIYDTAAIDTKLGTEIIVNSGQFPVIPIKQNGQYKDYYYESLPKEIQKEIEKDPTKADTVGTYTIEWYEVVAVGGANTGKNGKDGDWKNEEQYRSKYTSGVYESPVPLVKDKIMTYHLDGLIVLHDTTHINVKFMVQDVGKDTFALVRDYGGAFTIPEGSNSIPLSNIDRPDVPRAGQTQAEYPLIKPAADGTVYKFEGWYTDKNFTPESKFDFTADTISADTTFYAKYVPASANLTVTKTVTGKLGDTNKAFTFQILDASGNPVTLTTGNYEFSNTNGALLNDGTDGKFTLKDGASIIFKNLPSGEYKVIEEDYSGEKYDTSWQIGTDGEVYEKNSTATVTIGTTEQTVHFTNHRTLEPDLGVLLDTLPYIVILAVVAGGVALLMLRKHRKEDD